MCSQYEPLSDPVSKRRQATDSPDMSVQQPPTLDSPPVVGEMLKFIQDPLTLVADLRDECGPVARMNVVGLGNVYALAGPTGFEQVLVEKRDAFRKSAGFRVAFRDGISLSKVASGSASVKRWRNFSTRRRFAPTSTAWSS